MTSNFAEMQTEFYLGGVKWSVCTIQCSCVSPLEEFVAIYEMTTEKAAAMVYVKILLQGHFMA